MDYPKIIPWLLDGDVSIAYQTHRDLLDTDKPGLMRRIAGEGWVKRLLDKQNAGLYWGDGRNFYQPKWISAHYTLLDLRLLNLARNNAPASKSARRIFSEAKETDGGLNPSNGTKFSDVCVNGMAMNYGAWFGVPQEELKSVVDFLLKEHMQDGGFNCMSNRKGAVHSSLHSTLSVLEGIGTYFEAGYRYKKKELTQALKQSVEFILMHRFYLSDRTGKIIKKDFLRFPFSPRWKYDIMRALDWFQAAGMPYDKRMDNALDFIADKRTKDGRWKLNAPYAGLLHFEMEKAGQPSRWNTLRALRILKKYRADVFKEYVN